MAKNLKNVLINRIHDKQLKEYAEQYLSGTLIDIGCGTKPYQGLVSPHINKHIGVDHEECPHGTINVNLMGTAYKIPAENNSFESALCTAVLEHLEEPELALKECYRVLKPDGIAIYSVPFIWHLHEEPRDFYRFSKYGLRYLFEKTGFTILELKPLSGFWVTFGQLFTYNLYRLNKGPLRWFGIIHLIGLCLQTIAFVLDKFDKTEQWTWMYIVVARKKKTNKKSS